MISLVDSSVVARQLLGEPGRLEEWNQIREAFASRLLPLEMGRVIDRLRLNGDIDDIQVVYLHQELRRLLGSIEIVGLTESILLEASRAMPTVLGTLDAIHLATASEIRRQLGHELTVLTHDIQLARAGRALGFAVLGA